MLVHDVQLRAEDRYPVLVEVGADLGDELLGCALGMCGTPLLDGGACLVQVAWLYVSEPHAADVRSGGGQ
jgi:hypothetical protein